MAALRHVLWIGGPSSAGKTTIARRLARRHGLRWYGADARTWEHRDRAIAAGHDAAIRWERLTPRERWLEATPAEMLAMSLHAERGRMVVDDLRALPASPLVVAEGTTVAPSVVSSGVADPARAVWLLPTPASRRARVDARGGPRPTDRLYGLVAAEIERDVREHGAPSLAVDGTRGVTEMLGLVEERFAAALAEGPRAETVDERRALLRWANEAIVAQCRAYVARPWTTVGAESMLREFVCECDDPECDEPVELAVAAFPTAPGERVLAPGHA